MKIRIFAALIFLVAAPAFAQDREASVSNLKQAPDESMLIRAGLLKKHRQPWDYFDCRPVLIANSFYVLGFEVAKIAQDKRKRNQDIVRGLDERDMKNIIRSTSTRLFLWINASYLPLGRKPQEMVYWTMNHPLPFALHPEGIPIIAKAANEQYLNYMDWVASIIPNATQADYERLNLIIEGLTREEGEGQICEDRHPDWEYNQWDSSRGFRLLSIKETKEIVKKRFFDKSFIPKVWPELPTGGFGE